MAAATSSMTSSSLAVVLLCATAAFFATADAKTAGGDLVAKSCASMMSHDWRWWFDDAKSCESTLRLDKRSAVAKHPRDLVLIAMDLAQRAVADVDAKVAGVLRSGAGHRSNDTALILRYCRLDYASVASTIPVCRAMVDNYKNPGGIAHRGQQLAANDYFECARRLRRDTNNCWFSLRGEKAVYKLVYKEVEEVGQGTELVAAMLEEMLGIVIDDHEPPTWL